MEKQDDKIETADGELSEEDLSGVAGGTGMAAQSKVAAQSVHAQGAQAQSGVAAQGKHSTGHVAAQSLHKGGH